jgi:hypothetical protein
MRAYKKLDTPIVCVRVFARATIVHTYFINFSPTFSTAVAKDTDPVSHQNEKNLKRQIYSCCGF